MTVSRHCLGRKAFVIAAALLVSAAARPAQCCSCIRPPEEITERDAEMYSLIIDAKVTGLELFDRSQNENPEMIFETDVRVTVSVNRSWLGSVPRQLSLWTHSTESACGYPFKVGAEYLIFVYKEQETVSLCSRTCKSYLSAEIESELNELFGEPLILTHDESTHDQNGT